MVIKAGWPGVRVEFADGGDMLVHRTSATDILASILHAALGWRPWRPWLETVDKGLHVRPRRFLFLGEAVSRARWAARVATKVRSRV